MNQTKEIELLRSVEQQYIDCGDTEIVEAIERAIESIKGNAESIIKILEPCEESFLQETYRQNCIDYVKRTMECVGYRDYIVEQLEKEPCKDVVSLEVYKQVIWERDIAIAQLKELGYGFGEKIRSCEDAVSRLDVMDMTGLYADWFESSDSYNDFVAELYKLPPVTPTRKKGKWINHRFSFVNDDEQIVTECHCNKCYGIAYFRTIGRELVGANLCPNCGAEMESEE